MHLALRQTPERLPTGETDSHSINRHHVLALNTPAGRNNLRIVCHQVCPNRPA